MWETLEAHWQACLQEAWDAYRAGSLPIGAVVVNGGGEIVGRGRNRTREAQGAPLAGNRLAHAEVNALLAADFNANPSGECTLYASTEPCPLCVGAAIMSNVKRIAYASRDPWAGGTDLLEASDYMRRQHAQISAPQNAELERVLVAIQVAWHLGAEGERAEPLVEAWRGIVPDGVAQGERLYASGELEAWGRKGQEVRDVVARLAG